MQEYLLLLHETPGDFGSLSPARMEEVVAEYAARAEDAVQTAALRALER